MPQLTFGPIIYLLAVKMFLSIILLLVFMMASFVDNAFAESKASSELLDLLKLLLLWLHAL